MKIDNFIEVIVDSNLFGKLPKEQVLKIFQTINYKIIECHKNQIIHHEDDVCSSLSFIIQGQVEIQKNDALGKTLTVATFTTGDTFGENLIFGTHNLYPMTVFSKSKSIILEIQKESIIKLCQINTEFLNEFLNAISNRALGLSLKLKEISLKTIREKITEFLLFQFNETGETKIPLNMTKQTWADKLGIERPSLSRELIKLKSEGIIDYDKHSIFILDVTSLY